MTCNSPRPLPAPGPCPHPMVHANRRTRAEPRALILLPTLGSTGRGGASVPPANTIDPDRGLSRRSRWAGPVLDESTVDQCRFHAESHRTFRSAAVVARSPGSTCGRWDSNPHGANTPTDPKSHPRPCNGMQSMAIRTADQAKPSPHDAAGCNKKHPAATVRAPSPAPLMGQWRIGRPRRTAERASTGVITVMPSRDRAGR